MAQETGARSKVAEEPDDGFSPWPSFTPEEAEALRRVLLSNRVNYWTGGEGRGFEAEFARWVGAGHAVALANGTIALELAWKALGIGHGDEVVVTPRSFVASAASIANAGGTPVFADVDRDSQNISPATIEPLVTSRTRAVLCVHLAGWPCEVDQIRQLVGDRDIRIVEDCAQAHGARHHDRSVGALGDIAAWSFCNDKIMTTGGEGGMITTNSRDLWSLVWSAKDHGRSWEAVHGREHPPGFRWLHESFGTNGRLTELQSALGRVQLGLVPEWHRVRTRNANAVLDAASGSPVFRVPPVPAHIEHAWYRCYVFVEPGALKTGWDRDRVMNEISARGVPCYTGSCPEIYLEKQFDGTPFRPPERLPVARELGETSLAFLVHPTLTDAEVDRTRHALNEVARLAAR